MIKKTLLFIAILATCNCVKAQDQFITYNNDAEKLLLKKANSSSDYIKLALTSEVSEDEANKILNNLDNDIKQLIQGSADISQPDKKIKAITQRLSNVFLKKYENNSLFSNIFSTGNYQCLGASVLYAYVLEQCNIPFQIKETVTNQYVVAFPETYNITLETIDPKRQYLVMDDKSKQNYVNALIKYKYLDEDYVTKVGVEQAFNDFFYIKTGITLKEAIGLLYYNKAIENVETGKTERAYSNILKAETLYPVKKTEFFKKLVLTDLIPTLKFNDLRDWVIVISASNDLATKEEAEKYLEGQFNDLVQNKLWKEGRQETVEQVYNYLELNLKDGPVKNDIEEFYFAEVGRYNLVANKFPQALQYLGKANAKNPNNVLVKSMILNTIGGKILDQSVGSVHNISLLDQYVKEFSFLADDPNIQGAYIYNYCYLGYTAFSNENKPEGEKYLQLMCKELDNLKPGGVKNEQQIGGVFGKASEYYYRTQGKQKALQILNTGLKYAPNSEQLTRKIKVIVDSGKH